MLYSTEQVLSNVLKSRITPESTRDGHISGFLFVIFRITSYLCIRQWG